MTVAKVFYCVTLAAVVMSSVWLSITAPGRLAVHFSYDGQANGFMTLGTYLAFTAFLTVLIVLLVPAAVIAGARRGHRVSGIANVRFWSRPENRPLYVKRVTDLSLLIGGVCATTLSVVNLLVVVANQDGGREMPSSPWLAAGVTAAVVAACVGAGRWYGRLPGDR